MRTEESIADSNSNELDAEYLLAERQRLEALFHEKFKKVITVMFTDLAGSTAITEAEGDLAIREVMKKHNDMLFPIVEKHQGTLVKTMGDGTLSYFPTAQDGARAACEFQRALQHYNASKNPRIPIVVTIGLHTGAGIVEKNDIFGDVVNVAARFDAQAEAHEICVSEDTFNALEDKAEIYCRYIRMAKLKGKKDEFKIFKIFWDPAEIEKDKVELLNHNSASNVKKKPKLSIGLKIFLPLAAGLIAVFFLIKGNELLTGLSSQDDKRSTRHTISQ